MIKVEQKSSDRAMKMTLEELMCRHNRDRIDCDAFIGKCGHGPSGKLYLVTGFGVCLAEDLKNIWDNECCKVEVERFVDISIKEL